MIKAVTISITHLCKIEKTEMSLRPQESHIPKNDRLAAVLKAGVKTAAPKDPFAFLSTPSLKKIPDKQAAFFYFFSKEIDDENVDTRLFLIGHNRTVYGDYRTEARRWGVPGGNVDANDAEVAITVGFGEVLAEYNRLDLDIGAFWAACREFCEEVLGKSAQDPNFYYEVKGVGELILKQHSRKLNQVKRRFYSRDPAVADTVVTSYAIFTQSPPQVFETTFFGRDTTTLSDVEKLGFDLQNKETRGFVWAVLDAEYEFQDLRGAGLFEYLFEEAPQHAREDEFPMIVYEDDEDQRDDVVLLTRNGMSARLKYLIGELRQRAERRRAQKRAAPS